MHHILAKRQITLLSSFAQSNVLLAFDFDGTLAPIAARPSAARLRLSTRRLLARASTCYPCIVISGRSFDDISRCVNGIPLWHVVGNHGIEPWTQNERHAERIRAWVRRLREPVTRHAGVFLEDKRYSLTIHFRQARDKAAARRAIRTALGGITGARIVGGKQAVSLVPRDAVHKGTALERARRLVACDSVIYVGDDDTDEDAFAAGPTERLLPIRVGHTRCSRATHYLKGQGEIDALLRTLIALRRRYHVA
jgi:trehalose 6-phosphate phosphatase